MISRRDLLVGVAASAVATKLPAADMIRRFPGRIRRIKPIFEDSIGVYRGVIIRVVPQWVMNDLRAKPQTFDFIGGVEIDGQA